MLIPPQMKMLGAFFDMQLQFCKGVMLKVSELGSLTQVEEEKMSDQGHCRLDHPGGMGFTLPDLDHVPGLTSTVVFLSRGASPEGFHSLILHN